MELGLLFINLHPNLFMSVYWQVQRLLIFQILVVLLECEFLSKTLSYPSAVLKNFSKPDISVRGIPLFKTVFRPWSRKWP